MTQPTPRNLQEELRKRNPFDAPEQEAYLNLVRTVNQFALEFRRLFKQHGLTEPQYNVLRILGGAGDSGRRCEAIGCEMVTPAPDVTRLVDRLVSSGLVERETDPTDRRAVIIRITENGRDLLDRMHESVLDLHREQLRHLSASKVGDLNALLFEARWGRPPAPSNCAPPVDGAPPLRQIRPAGAAPDVNPGDRSG